MRQYFLDASFYFDDVTERGWCDDDACLREGFSPSAATVKASLSSCRRWCHTLKGTSRLCNYCVRLGIVRKASLTRTRRGMGRLDLVCSGTISAWGCMVRDFPSLGVGKCSLQRKELNLLSRMSTHSPFSNKVLSSSSQAIFADTSVPPLPSLFTEGLDTPISIS